MVIQEEHFPSAHFIRYSGYPFPHTVISSAARNLFRPLFPSSFAKPFTGSTAPHLFAIRCFPFFAIGHAPSYRQRKRSLDFARDDDTRRMLSKHSLCRIYWIRASPYHAKKPRQEPELFCVRKTYLPNCASMVPAATAVPITPATFGPIACISR